MPVVARMIAGLAKVQSEFGTSGKIVEGCEFQVFPCDVLLLFHEFDR